MKEQLFLIGIGGTGMRCLEAFVHSCAMGMYDNTVINMLALDTDLENGNFVRLQELVEDVYQKVKGYNKNQTALSDTFFSAKLNFYKFCPDYSKIDKNGKFTSLTKYVYSKEEEKELANLLLTENIRDFDLKHGYRAQTHLGSFLMLHGILEEVRKNPHGSIAKYIQSIFDASETGTARVFVLGSVFGGTGASSIPIIPKAFNSAINIMIPGKSLSKVYFGAVLLSSYFKFATPDEKQRSAQKVIANAKNFALNSQVAMMFYNEDPTVKSTYQKFYMLGTPNNDFETTQNSNEVITGGASQKNDSHFIELLSAFSAYDFFNTPLKDLEAIRNEKKEVQYYYRALNENGRVDFKDYVKPDKVKEFGKKFGMLTAMSFLIYPDFTDFFAAAQAGTLAKNNISGYEDIDPAEVAAIKKYFAMYHFAVDSNGDIIAGWLRQLQRSAKGSDNFLFNADLFSFDTYKELKKFKFNKSIYRPNDADMDKHEFSVGIFGNPYDSFKDEFVKKSDDPALTNKSEKLIKRMYNTLLALYEFK
jgi:hypothetical protein